MSTSTARDKLVALLKEYANGRDTQEFCSAYEHTFNFEIDQGELTDNEFRIFQTVFDEVVLYSPFEDDRARYPGYRDEHAIRNVVVHALSVV
jgi:CRISPR/Cas system CSM-associated protein Csm2 small subunit